MSKNIAITGGNSGIGLETARGLYGDGHTVIIGSRNEQKNIDAIKEIMASRPNSSGTIKYFPLDLTKKESIEKFAEFVKQEFKQLDILINNAGLIRNQKQLSSLGAEMTYVTNHFGHFYLTYLLFDCLNKAKEARIINVSSKLHFRASQNLADDLNCEQGWSAFDSYGKSKLANVMFTVGLADKLSNRPNIKAVCLHPGVVASDFYSGSCLMKFFRCCCCCFLVGNEAGATTNLHLSRVAYSQLRSGAYYDDDTSLKEMNPFGQNRGEVEKLWKASEKMYGIVFEI